MKKVIFIFIAALLSIDSIHALSKDNQISLSLSEAKKMFLDRNLTLIAKRYDVSQAEAQVLQARLYDNPVISVEENLYNSITKKFFDFGKTSEQTVEVEQEIKLAGQRNKQILVEKVNVEMAKYQYEEVIRTLYGEMNRQFIDIYFMTQTTKVYDQEIVSLSKLIQAIAVQQSKGNVSLLEKSRLEVELMALKKEKNDVENQLVADRQELNLLLGCPASVVIIPKIDEQALKNLKLSSITYESMDTLLVDRPDLKLAQAGIKSSKANLSLQKALAAPSFSIKGSYDRTGSFINNYVAIGVGMSIPIFDRNQGNIKAAKFNVEQSYTENDEAIQKAHSELFSAYQQWKNATNLYQSSDTTVECNFSKLLTGSIDNFTKRNINMLEFLDYYESYKNTCLQLYDTRKDVFLKMEAINETIGKTVFGY
jgi:outer membrane protein, heavy metal efflux system